jgi:hypothetical protein
MLCTQIFSARTPSRLARASAFLIGVLFGTVLGQAMPVRPVDIAALTASAELIVTGQITDVTKNGSNGPELLETRVSDFEIRNGTVFSGIAELSAKPYQGRSY